MGNNRRETRTAEIGDMITAEFHEKEREIQLIQMDSIHGFRCMRLSVSTLKRLHAFWRETIGMPEKQKTKEELAGSPSDLAVEDFK